MEHRKQVMSHACEYPDCERRAVVEWIKRDPDTGDVFYTYRCRPHPVHDPEYEPSPLEVSS